MALCKTSVLKIYNAVIEDVITGVRDIFMDEGLDEQVLQELKLLWESKLTASKAVEHQSEVVEVKGNAKKEHVDNGSHHTHHNGAIQRTQHYVKTNQVLLPQTIPPVQSTSTAIITEEKLIPIQITLPAQATLDSATRVLTIHVPASALNGPQLHTLLTGPVITATMGLPTSLASSLLQQHVNAALELQNQQQFQQQHVMTTTHPGVGHQQHTISSTNNGVKLDGGIDTSDDEEEGSEDEASDGEDEDDKEDEDPDGMDDQANEEEPLNSEDDVTDEEPADLFDTDNVVVCQYDKITRSRNKWKFYLKDGIMNLEGEDYLFQKASGDAEW